MGNFSVKEPGLDIGKKKASESRGKAKNTTQQHALLI
jgi:hypothetical protein